MVDISNIKRLAFDYVARMYVVDNAITELLGEQIMSWYNRQLARYDPCDLAEITVALTVATNFEVPGFMTPQYGHVFMMVFEEKEGGQTKTHVSELFLRVSETGVIVEIFPFRPTVH